MNINESNAPNGAAVNPAVPEALISKLPDRSRRWSVSIPYSAKKTASWVGLLLFVPFFLELVLSS